MTEVDRFHVHRPVLFAVADRMLSATDAVLRRTRGRATDRADRLGDVRRQLDSYQ